jgi:hypothetical protein
MTDQNKKELDDHILQEWDVCRRTAEFFDDQLGRLREIGIASSVAIIGLAVQFQTAIGILLLPLNIIFTLLDYRSQRYLAGVSSYAKRIEDSYQFAGSGLTHSIRSKIGDKESSVYRYFVYAINGGFLATGSAFLWLSLEKSYAIGTGWTIYLNWFVRNPIAATPILIVLSVLILVGALIAGAVMVNPS